MTGQLTRQFLSVAAGLALIVPQYVVDAAQPVGNITGPVPLPSLHRLAEALAVDTRGTIIVGSASDVSDRLHAVKWTLQSDGSWALSDLAWPPGASSTIARGVNDRGDVSGNDSPFRTSRALLWLAGTILPRILGCSADLPTATVYGISADAQVVVGGRIDLGPVTSTSTAAVWRPDGTCREDLPLLAEGESAGAFAVNGDGTIIGGGASIGGGARGVPARWTNVAGEWRIEQLDARDGAVLGADATGDLAGYVATPCGVAAVCQRAVIWYTTGESRELGTLGGADSAARDINSAGEVVGISTPRNGINTAFFWSPDPAVGMLQLPFNGRWAAANALSDVRADGTRLVVGQDFRGRAIAWVVRNP
jgi:probable HAF family extracellular repeat protein